MNKKEQCYWKGISEAQRRNSHRPSNAKGVFEFLDDAFQFVKKLRGKIVYESPTEVELYKKWIILAKH